MHKLTENFKDPLKLLIPLSWPSIQVRQLHIHVHKNTFLFLFLYCCQKFIYSQRKTIFLISDMHTENKYVTDLNIIANQNTRLIMSS